MACFVAKTVAVIVIVTFLAFETQKIVLDVSATADGTSCYDVCNSKIGYYGNPNNISTCQGGCGNCYSECKQYNPNDATAQQNCKDGCAKCAQICATHNNPEACMQQCSLHCVDDCAGGNQACIAGCLQAASSCANYTEGTGQYNDQQSMCQSDYNNCVKQNSAPNNVSTVSNCINCCQDCITQSNNLIDHQNCDKGCSEKCPPPGLLNLASRK